MREAADEGLANARAIERAAIRERRRLAALSFPAMIVIGLVVVVPGLWLFSFSFWSRNGFTFASYAQLLDPSYAQSMAVTLQLAGLVTCLCAVLGYPLAYTLLLASPRVRAVLFCFVLFPLWTSVLVRTYAWQIILQRRGIVNTFLIWIGAIDRPLGLANGFGASVAGMVHIMLPFLILPLFASMRSIDPSLTRAAASLGASPTRAFWSVFAPMTLPGLLSGMIIVFVLALGFYVTPALLGGGRVITWAMRIEQSLMISSDWGATSALGVALVLVAGGILAVVGRFGSLNQVLGTQK